MAETVAIILAAGSVPWRIVTRLGPRLGSLEGAKMSGNCLNCLKCLIPLAAGLKWQKLRYGVFFKTI